MSLPRWNFPLARRGWALGMIVLANWRERHQHPFNFAIHLIGVPLVFLSLPALLVVEWYWCAAAFVCGYLLQFLGHVVEGNDMGELIPIKKLLGLPIVAVVPRPSVPPSPPKL